MNNPFGINSNYFLLVIVPLIFGMWAQVKVSSNFKKYSQVTSASGLTGAQVARRILDENGLTHVQIEHIKGNLTDHFDPRTNVVRLSDSVYGSSSIAAIGVAAHECGHAVQYGTSYFPMRIRSAIVPVTSIGSKIAVPMVLAGMLFSFQPLIMIGIWGYALIALFQLITLPVEFNASSRAMKVVAGMGVRPEEQRAVKTVLTSAALTYVAALVSALSTLLRLLLIFGNGNNRR